MLLAVGAPLFFFIGYIFKQQQIQHAMLEKLESKCLKTIAVKKAAVKWVKKDKEILVDGKLFDVKTWYAKEDTIIFLGLFDDEENKLKKEFAGLLEHTKEKSSPLNQLLEKYFSVTAVAKINVELNIPHPGKYKLKNYCIANEVAVSQSKAVITPPPNI